LRASQSPTPRDAVHARSTSISEHPPSDKEDKMAIAPRERALHDGFLIGIWFKFAIGALQALAGITLLLVSQAALAAMVARWTNPELAEEPDSHIATWAQQGVADLGSGSRAFVTIYLLSHGIIKLGLIWAMLRRKMWAYPWSIGVMSGFIAYQLYRFGNTHSMALVVLSLLDAIVVYLIWQEYRTRKANGFARPIAPA
jgi:uncharacterized membrane protein